MLGNSDMKRIAVIGAGASGLTAIKCCLDEGLEPVCFERGNYISGLWHYTAEVEEGQACVMKSTVINTSKEMMCYSDFPKPAEYPIYMHNKCVDKYFHMYAGKFGLKKHINLNTEVISVKPTSNFKTDGTWEVVARDKSTGTTKVHVFDGVLVCTGHHANKNIPVFPGLDKFQGTVTHTHDYKDFHGGNSGGDVSTELSRISSQVYLSTRSGSWIFNRVGENGNPGDMQNSRRFIKDIIRRIPSIAATLVKSRLKKRLDHSKYGLQPKYGPLSAHPTVNDELPNRIISGGVIIKDNVKEFTENGVVFVDGTKVDHIDAVVLATGYIFGFPFIDKNVLKVKDNKVDLYKYMFPPELEMQTLAIIGCVQPLGAIMPISEMQCRLATRVFKRQVVLPNNDDMWKDIKSKRHTMATRFKESKRHTIQVDYVEFMDELADMIDCKPDIKKLFLTDPKLAVECYFGSCTPYQFRLMGPGAWEGAREAILTQWDRTYQPLNTRNCGGAEQKNGFGVFYTILTILLAMLLYFIL